MSTTDDRASDPTYGPPEDPIVGFDHLLEAIPNEEDGTVTFAPTTPEELSLPATEWITVDATALVDLQAQR